MPFRFLTIERNLPCFELTELSVQWDRIAIVYEAHQKARAESARLKSEFAAHGAARSSRLIVAVAGRVDTIHKEALAEAMPRGSNPSNSGLEGGWIGPAVIR